MALSRRGLLWSVLVAPVVGLVARGAKRAPEEPGHSPFQPHHTSGYLRIVDGPEYGDAQWDIAHGTIWTHRGSWRVPTPNGPMSFEVTEEPF